MEKPAPPVPTAATLESLSPDLVLSARYTYDHKTESPTKAAKLDLDRLVHTLISNGYFVQVRPGLGVSNLLVFVRLSKEALAKAVQKARESDFLYGVNNDLFDKNSKLDEAERARIVYQHLTVEAGITPGIGVWDFVTTAQPIHNVAANKALVLRWTRLVRIADADIDAIKAQYGTKIALYFVFLRTYMYWLTVPAAIGAAIFFTGAYKFLMAYTFLILGWLIFFLNAWKRTERKYAIRWDVKSVGPLSVSQPANLRFTPLALVTDYLSDSGAKSFKYYPSHLRFLKKLAFVPVVCVFALALISWQFLCFFVEIFINELYDGPLKGVFALAPTIMLAVFVQVLTLVYKIVASRFVNWENHRTIPSLQDSMNEKLFVISFLTLYLALFITCFVYLPMGHSVNAHLNTVVDFVHTKVHGDIPLKRDHFMRVNPHRMNAQFFFAMVTNQVIGFILEYGLPFATRFITEIVTNYKKDKIFYDYNDLSSEEAYLTEVRKQVYELGDYDVNDDLRQMVVQFGYLVLFSLCWTIAPLICLVVNYLQFVGDVTKIFLENKRPIPARSNLIDPWNRFLSLLVWVGLIVGPALSSMYRDSAVMLETAPESYSGSAVAVETWSLLTVVIFSEHVYLVLNYVVGAIIAKVSSKEVDQDLQHSLAVRKSFAKRSEIQIRSLSEDDADEQWALLGSLLEKAVEELAIKVVKSVKQSTKVKHSNPEPSEKPSAKPSPGAAPQVAYETINEKVGATGYSL